MGPRQNLLPVRRQDGLDLLRLLIDHLIPSQAGLLREGSPRLNELIHLRVEQRLAVARLDRLDLGHRRVGIPVLNCNALGHAMRRDS
jgi:hypothetical protein